MQRRDWILVLVLSITALCLGAGAGVVAVYLRGLPSLAEMEGIKPSRVTKVYAADGTTVIGEFFEEKRLPVRLHQVPKFFVDAIVATEDRRFREHFGIDLQGIARAVVADLRNLSTEQGASTITQQLARNLFLSHERTWSRKIREALLAFKIERTYSKDEILELYINQIYFGSGAYGVEAASQRYFSKHVEELDLAEATLLAGLPGSPSNFSPFAHPDAAKRRQRVVLSSMVASGMIDEAVADSIAALPIQLHPSPPRRNEAPYFIEWLRQQIESRYGSALLHRGGLRIYTTLDPQMQRAAETALSVGLERQEERKKYPVTFASYHDSLASLETKDQSNSASPPYLQGAILVLEPATGAVRAMVGGRSFDDSQFNRATQARRQVGSLFKPFVFALAIEDGWTPADIVVDGPVVLDTGADELWEPVNYERKFYGPITLREGLAHSRNLLTIRLALELGIDRVVAMARRLGIQSPIPEVPSVAIGSADLTLWEMARAYTAFANHGILVEPFAIVRVEDAVGRVLETHTPARREVMRPAETYVLESMLRSVVDEGTARSARAMGFRRPAAGKTGTTDDHVDAWFLGYTPDLLAGVWVGFDDRTPLGNRQSGSVVALPIWTQFMMAALRDRPVRNFVVPDGVSSAEICPVTGKLRGPRCPTGRMEVFVAGTEPVETCTHPGSPDEEPVASESIGLDF